MYTLPNFFRTDFSAEAEFLSTLTKGPLSEDEASSLAGLLGAHDLTEGQGQWVAQGPGMYSLEDAEVIYVGDNNVDLPTHPLFDKVVGIRLRDDNGPRRIYLNYNVA